MFNTMSTLKVEPVSMIASPNVGQCMCGLVSESRKGHNAGRRTVSISRMERTALWSFVSLGSFLVIGCFIMEVFTRYKLEVIAGKCLLHQDVIPTPRTNHDDVIIPTQRSSTEGEKINEDLMSRDDAVSTPSVVKRRPHKKRSRAVRTLSNQVSTRASHFVANSDGSVDFQYSDATCIPKWDGMFCRNGTFWSNHTAQVMKFFVGAEWTKQGDGGIQPALVQSTPGMFTVQSGGLYLIYINVIIRTTEDKHDIEVYSDQTRLLRCRQGLDYVRQTDDRFLYSKTRTCSVMGLFYLEDGAVVTSRVLQARTTLSLGPDSTNFGAIHYNTRPQLRDISFVG